MKDFYVPPQFEVVRDPQRCVNCKVCVEQCPNGVHRFDENPDDQSMSPLDDHKKFTYIFF